jgi:hypothetical protein
MAGSERCSVHVGLGGRPTALTDEVADQLETMLRAGNYVHVAIRAAGVSRSTFNEWMRRGLSRLKRDRPYRELRERVETAQAEGQVRHVAMVSKAAADDWRAATWLLERQYPALWGGVSVRMRPPAEEAGEAEVMVPDEDDPFMEVDELAEARRRRTAS